MEAVVLSVQINKCNVQMHLGFVVKKCYLEEHRNQKKSSVSDSDCIKAFLYRYYTLCFCFRTEPYRRNNLV